MADDDDTTNDDAETEETGPDTGKPDSADEELAKWKAMARKHERDAKALRDQVKNFEDQGKTELERATAKAQEAEARAQKAEFEAIRIEVALDKAPEGMSITQVRKLARRLQGDTREALEADATELFTDFAPGKDEGSGDGETGSGHPTTSRPTERLRQGSGSEEPEPAQARDEVLAKIPRL